MKKISKIIATIAIILVCVSCGNMATTQENRSPNSVKNDTLTFSEYGFSISAPCVWKEVPKNANEKFLFNYAGIENEDDPSKFVFYQIIVSRLPIGYKDIPRQKLETMLDDELKEIVSSFESYKPIRFGYEDYKGYEVSGHHENYKQKGVFFIKDNLIIALTIITNYDIDAHFNKFTNNFVTLPSAKSAPTVTNTSSNNTTTSAITQTLAMGYKISAPCILEKDNSRDAGNDYEYIGITDKVHPDDAYVYKVIINNLPMHYSSMLESDQKTIKNNTLFYLKSKEEYKSVKVNIESIFAYIAKYHENDIFFNDCLILTDTQVVELIICAQKKIPEMMMTDFVASLNN